MSLEERDHKPTAEVLAELTGRPAEEFEIPEDVAMPALEELDSHEAAEFYSEED